MNEKFKDLVPICFDIPMFLKTGLFIMPLFFIFSCAPPVFTEKPPEMYWPLPPEKPRIKFVDIILGSLDVTKLKKIKSVIFGAEGDVRFNKPFGIAINKQWTYVTDLGGILAFDFEKGGFQMIGASDLRSPSGISVTDDRIYVGDVIRKKIYVYDLGGKNLMDFGSGEIDTVAGMAIDKKRKRLFVSDSRKHMIFIYGLDGRLQSSFGKKGVAAGEFNIPYGIAVDTQGRIYVVDSGNFRLQIFDEDGKFLKSIGRVGTYPGTFARPKGVAIDSEGHIYVLDSAFGNFQIFDFNGNILLDVGNSGTEPAEFMLPASIYIDENDQIFVVDQINKRIQIFQYLKE